jgi:hypothetical protein
MQSTWAWRTPSALQGLFSLICILILPFLPESPRWLIYQDRHEEAIEVIALTIADCDAANPNVQILYQEIIDTIHFEKTQGETLGVVQIFKTPSSRKRLLLVLSVAVFSMLSGKDTLLFLRDPLLTLLRKQHYQLLSWNNAEQCWYHRYHNTA